MYIVFTFDKIRYLYLVYYQFEESNDPLEKITTAEAIRVLVDSYRSSQYCYAAREKVEQISKVVSVYVIKVGNFN